MRHDGLYVATNSNGKKNSLFIFWRIMIGPHSRFSRCKFGSVNEFGHKNGVGRRWRTTNWTYLEISYQFCIWPRRSKVWQRWNRANRFPTDLTKCNIVGQPYPNSSHLVWAIDVVWLTTHTHPPASMVDQCYPCNCSRAGHHNKKIVQINFLRIRLNVIW